VDFRILGPLEAEEDGRLLPLGGSKQRALLALLLLRANNVVPRDLLIDELWGERAPATAATALQGYVSGLRKILGADRILTRAPGYLVRVDPDEIDISRFEGFVREGRAALDAGDASDAVEKLSAALALWHGPPLAGLDSTSFAYAERLRLEELQLSALEDRIDAELALGRHADVVAELEGLVSRHPLRERLRGQLMLALYRCGRQAEALETYQDARRLLVGELGLEPSVTLRNLEQEILNQDPALEPPPGRPAAGAERPRRRVVAAFVVIAMAVLAALAALLLTRNDAPRTLVANSLVKIDADTNTVADVIPVGRDPGVVTSGWGSVWVVNMGDETLSRVSIHADRVDLLGGLRVKQPAGLAAVPGHGLFVGSFEESVVTQVDPATLQVETRLRVPGRTALFIAAGGGSLWITQPPLDFVGAVPSTISRVSLADGQVQRTFKADVGVLPAQIAFGAGAAWVENSGDSSLWRIGADDNRIERFTVGRNPTAVAVGFGSVWVTSAATDTVWRLDAVAGQTDAVIAVGRSPLALTIGAGSVWVSNQQDGTVSRIDPATNTVSKTIRVGFHPHGLVVAGTEVWVAVSQRVL